MEHEKGAAPKGEEPVYIPIQTDSIRLDSIPQFDLYFRAGSNQPYVLYCERKTKFTHEAKKRLAQNRITKLYIIERDRGAYGRYLVENLAAALTDPTLTLREKSTVLYDAAQSVVKDVLDEPAKRANVEQGKEIVQQTVDFMCSETFVLEHLLRTISTDYYLYTHSVNVTAYAIALAMRSGFGDEATLRELANGALVHDVGEAKVSAAIRNKPGPLTETEWAEVRKHPVEGVRLLRQTGCLGEIALDIVLSHHEKLNGSGYPNQRKGVEISPFVRIVTIADVFDALTTDRSHRKRMSTFEALKLMSGTMHEELDKELFRQFVAMMGLAKS